MVPKLLGFAKIVCFAPLPHPVSVDGIMQVANVT